MMESWIIATISRALVYGTPLLLATLGEIYSERSGVLNLGIEGMMILGAFSAFAVASISGNPWLGLLVAGVVGGLASLAHAFVSITLRANQVVSGLALTVFGLGLAGMLGRGWEGTPLYHPLSQISVPILKDIPLLGPILFTKQDALVYIAIALSLVLWALLFKTHIGNAIRAVGENPEAADAAGINVWKVRYLCVCFGGILAGIAGGYLSVAYRPAWTEGMTSGMGWLAIALTIFAFWDPKYGMLGAYFFGALFHLSYRLQPWIAPELLRIMPYALAILVLTLVSRLTLKERMGAPAALTVPYKREQQ